MRSAKSRSASCSETQCARDSRGLSSVSPFGLILTYHATRRERSCLWIKFLFHTYVVRSWIKRSQRESIISTDAKKDFPNEKRAVLKVSRDVNMAATIRDIVHRHGHILYALYRYATGNGATVGRRPNRVWIFNCLHELPLFQNCRGSRICAAAAMS